MKLACRSVAVFALGVAFFVPSQGALAQGSAAGWLPTTPQGGTQGGGAGGFAPDKSRTEGPGFRLGDLELHPGVGVELGYDSNLFYEDTNALDTLILRVTPHLNISTLGGQRRGEGEEQGSPPMLNFEAGVSASYYAFFSDEARNNLSIDGNVRATINPQGTVSLTLYDQLGRSIRPFTERAGTVIDFARIRNEAGAALNVSSDGGVFGGTFGYAFQIDIFEGDTFNYANNFNHRIDAGATWKFLPSTALIYDFQLNVGTYVNDSVAAAVVRPDSYRVGSRIGLNGAVTEKLSLSAFVGYTAGFFEDPTIAVDEYESVAGQAELRWKASPSTQLAAGYSGDFSPAFAGSYARRDGGYVKVSTTVAGALLLSGSVSGYHVDFGPQLEADGTPLGVGGAVDRTDFLLRASGFAEYRFTEWLAVNLSVTYTGNFTGFRYTRDLGGALVPDPAEFQKFEAWLGVRAFY